MNRFFGFFKEKLIEAKQQNQSDLQNLVGAFEGEQYSKAKMLSYLQQIKTNYLQWNILIANEASTGLYFSQIHNKTCVIKKARGEKEIGDKILKNQISVEQMQKTLEQLKNIDKLNREWVNMMSGKVSRLQNSLLKSAERNINQGFKQIVLQSDQRNNSKQKVLAPNISNLLELPSVPIDREEKAEQNPVIIAQYQKNQQKKQEKVDSFGKNQQ